MTLAEIVLKLRYGLSQWSTLFGTQLSCSAAIISGSNINITTTAAHGLSANDVIYLSGFYEKIAGTISSAGNNIWHVETAAPHDLTLNELERQEKYIRITSQSFVTPTEVRLVNVGTRTRFAFYSDVAPFSDEYDCNLLQFHYGAVNSPCTVVSAPTTTSLVLSPSGNIVGLVSDISGDLSESRVSKLIRVSGAVDYETALASYTTQDDGQIWAFVVFDNYTANRSKFNTNDAQDMAGKQQDYRQQIIGNFSVYIFVPNKGSALTQTNGRAGRDVIESIRGPLFKSILNLPLSTGLYYETQNVVTYAGDGYFDYTGPCYVHRFQFQQVFDITYPDTAAPYQGGDRAFRDIHLSFVNTFSVGDSGNPDADYGVSVDLDVGGPTIYINVINGDDIISEEDAADITISGTAIRANGQTVTIMVDGDIVGTAIVYGGEWSASSIDLTAYIDGATHEVTADVSDFYGNPAIQASRTISIGFDSDASALFARMTTAPSSDWQLRINDLIVALKDAGYFSRFDSLYIPRTGETQQAALLDWRRSNKSATLHGSAVWDTNYGFVGSTVAGSYVDTDFTPSIDAENLTVNSGGYGCYVSALPTNANSALFGFLDNLSINNTRTKLEYTLSNNHFGPSSLIHGNGSLSPASGTAATGVVQLNRTAINSASQYLNGDLLDASSSSNPSRTLAAYSVYLLAENNTGTEVLRSNGKLAAWWAGDDFTDVELSEIAAMIDAYFDAA